ncbi:MAG: translation initiation factor 3, partial [Ascidiaceihabitans sp.]
STTEAATDTVSEAADATADAATDATETATDAAGATADAATETASEAADATTEAVDATTEAATEATSGGIADLLTTEGFDYDKVVEMVEGSEMGAFQKTALKTSLEKARDNPEVLETVLGKIKEAMGL